MSKPKKKQQAEKDRTPVMLSMDSAEDRALKVRASKMSKEALRAAVARIDDVLHRGAHRRSLLLSALSRLMPRLEVGSRWVRRQYLGRRTGTMTDVLVYVGHGHTHDGKQLLIFHPTAPDLDGQAVQARLFTYDVFAMTFDAEDEMRGKLCQRKRTHREGPCGMLLPCRMPGHKAKRKRGKP